MTQQEAINTVNQAFTTFLKRSPTSKELSIWANLLVLGIIAYPDLEKYIKSTNEYVQKQPQSNGGQPSQAGSTWFKPVYVWIALGAIILYKYVLKEKK